MAAQLVDDVAERRRPPFCPRAKEQDAPQRIAAVRSALAARDAELLYKAVHTLKGSAGNFGAPEVVGYALQLEAHARAGDIDSALIEFGFLEAQMDQLVGELAAARQTS